MQLSTHFRLSEFTASQTATRRGIDNTPPSDVVDALKRTALGLEAVRSLLMAPIIISSGYRSPALNKAIGGAKSSQHVKGEAVDFICPGFGSPKDVCEAIARSNLRFDQLIYEGTWVHISFADTNRREVLAAHFNVSGVSYTKGLV